MKSLCELPGRRRGVDSSLQRSLAMPLLRRTDAVVLAGGRVYKMDHAVMLKEHVDSGTQVTARGITLVTAAMLGQHPKSSA